MYTQESVGVTSVAASDGHAEGPHRVEQLPNKLVANEIPIGSDSIAIFNHTGVKQSPANPGMEQNIQQNCVGDNGSATWHLYAEDLGGALVEHIMEDNQHVGENIPSADNTSKAEIHERAKPAIPHPLFDYTSGDSNGEFVINGRSNESLPLAECMLSVPEDSQIPATTGGQIRKRHSRTNLTLATEACCTMPDVIDISQPQNTAESGVIAVLCDSWSTGTEARVAAVSSEIRSIVAEAEAGADEASDSHRHSTLMTTYNALKLAMVISSLLAAFQPLAKEKSPPAGWVTTAFAICAALVSLTLLFMEWRGEWLNAAQQQRDQVDCRLRNLISEGMKEALSAPEIMGALYLLSNYPPSASRNEFEARWDHIIAMDGDETAEENETVDVNLMRLMVWRLVQMIEEEVLRGDCDGFYPLPTMIASCIRWTVNVTYFIWLIHIGWKYNGEEQEVEHNALRVAVEDDKNGLGGEMFELEYTQGLRDNRSVTCARANIDEETRASL
ncbi:hypothetical protein BDQ17DRAFT_1430300 [Cyathus striatus]|nr:hypothetical protein BDQ17DRAFT_1430300 [Cyathus striatus]